MTKLKGPFALRNGHIYDSNRTYVASIISSTVGGQVVEILNDWWVTAGEHDYEQEQEEHILLDEEVD